MDTHQLECCAIQEIYDLGDHDSPEDAMADLCRQHTSYGGGKMGTFGGFMIFSALIKVGKNGKPNEYGPAFAKFIEDNKLGTVMASPVNKNFRNHPTHSVQVWIWCPNMTTVRAWWSKNKKKAKTTPSYYDYGNEGEDDGGW